MLNALLQAINALLHYNLYLQDHQELKDSITLFLHQYFFN